VPTLKKETNGLLSELQSYNTECRLCLILKELPSSERDALMEVIGKMKTKNATKEGRAKHSYTYRWLSEVLTKHGFEIDLKEIRKYFAGKCDC